MVYDNKLFKRQPKYKRTIISWSHLGRLLRNFPQIFVSMLGVLIFIGICWSVYDDFGGLYQPDSGMNVSHNVNEDSYNGPMGLVFGVFAVLVIIVMIATLGSILSRTRY